VLIHLVGPLLFATAQVPTWQRNGETCGVQSADSPQEVHMRSTLANTSERVCAGESPIGNHAQRLSPLRGEFMVNSFE
jgi:hypothetical protein